VRTPRGDTRTRAQPGLRPCPGRDGQPALQPSVEPVLDYDQIQPRDRFWRSERLLYPAYGEPIDSGHWRANHPTAIAHDRAAALRTAELAIYLECGDEDSFGLYRGAEYLHRLLFDQHIAHEYRLVRGADHLGASMPGRFLDAMRFLMKVLERPAPDPQVAELREYVRKLKQTVGVLDE
jgi:S-formylglutathione hydrolase